MMFLGLLLVIIGLCVGLYLHGYGADLLRITIRETSRKNLITASIALVAIGCVLILLGLLL